MSLTKVKTNMIDGSTGGGAENLITDGAAESASGSIFTAYADAAGTRPVDGTGGSPNVTTALNSTNPINGTKDFTLIKDAANRQGQGWAVTPISIPLAYRAKSLKLSIKYLITSGTFVAGTSSTDGDVIWYLYDVTNSKLVEPSNIKMFSSSTTVSDVYEATVQLDYNTASVRLIAHVASTSAVAYTLQVDDVTLTPQTYVFGSPITEWQSVTCSGSWSTNTTYSALRRRNGGEYEYQIKLSLAGAPTAASLTINLPTGDTIDTTRLIDTTVTYGELPGSSAQIGWTSSSSGVSLIAKYNTTTSVGIFAIVGSNVPVYNANAVNHISPVTLASGDFILVYLKLPIVGLSSSVQMSESCDTRQEYFSATKSGNQSISNTTSTKVTFDTFTNNTHGSWDGTNNRYVVKTAGPFNIAGTIGWAANATGYRQVAYGINGGTTEVLNQTNSVGVGDPTTCGFAGTTPYLNAGDYIELYVYQNSGGALNAAFNLARLRITKYAGPQAIAASEKICAIYKTSAGQSLGTGAVVIDYGTKEEDTHGAVTTGASWKFTAPRSDFYDVIGASRISTASRRLDIYKNGTALRVLCEVGVDVTVPLATTLYLKAGEYINIVANNGSSATVYSDDKFNYVIVKSR